MPTGSASRRRGVLRPVRALKFSTKKSAYLKRASSATLVITLAQSQIRFQSFVLALPMARPQPQNIRIEPTIKNT